MCDNLEKYFHSPDRKFQGPPHGGQISRRLRTRVADNDGLPHWSTASCIRKVPLASLSFGNKNTRGLRRKFRKEQ